ncbi:DUF6252 family protein [Dyadobacter bucti]|uniref:DUF6252 family protein n=1 Tax=Dyadobacter bucti TaxID=2572203 RepID=UPI003F6FEF47
MHRVINFLITASVLCGCQKEKLPLPTQEGKNIFACKVNNEIWIPKGSSSLGGTTKPIFGGLYENSFTREVNFGLTANLGNGDEVEIFLNSFDPGTHNLEKSTVRSGPSPDPINYGFYHANGKNYITSEKATGFVKISKADTINHIISGTFEFYAANATGDIVKITDGRFDIHYPLL